MTQRFGYGPFRGASEEEAFAQIALQCFNFPSVAWDPYLQRVGRESFRVLRSRGRVLGGLAIYRMGQYFGGRSIPTGGIALVGVPPEVRASGVAKTLMERTLLELHEEGTPLSTLYPATQRLYRKVGYEQAGSRVEYTMPGRSFSEKDRSLSASPVPTTDPAPFTELYKLWAERGNGLLDRNRAIWERVLRPYGEDAIYAYRFGEERSEGYVVFTQRRQESGYNLVILDWVALTPAAYRRLLSFLGDHRSLARTVLWYGPAGESLLCLFEEQDALCVRRQERWMLRIVDAERAISQRGYPADVKGELHLKIHDGLIRANEGRFVLRVANGRGGVERGGRGRLEMDIRALAALYASFLTPIALHSMGWMRGDSASLATATRLFSGPEPWMPDPF